MIKVKNVTKRFGATVALSGVSAEFHAGEVHCLLGENGAGKSTMGKLLAGIHQPDEGSIEVDGAVVSLPNPKAARLLGIAVCYQELSLAKHLSVRANLCLGSEAAFQPFVPIRKAQEARSAEEVLRKLGLDLNLEQAVGELPVAQQQLIEIGKALMVKPRAVVFDEPTAMLGAVEKQKFLDVLKQLREEGVAVILVTHHIDDVMAVSDRITVMRNGRTVGSFAMDASITEDVIVERLTGNKRERLAVERAQSKSSGAPVLRIAHMKRRDGQVGPLEIRRGQVVALYGVVGCGAERVVGALAGQGSPGRLEFTLAGRPYRPSNATQALQQGVAYLPSGRAANCIFPGRSIAENLTISNLRRFGRFGVVSASAEKAHAQSALKAAAVKFANADLPITSLSGGNQQKVLLARALSAARELLILEEPTAGVDIDAKAQIHARIREAVSNGLAVLMLSCDLEETIALSDVVLTMYRDGIVGSYEMPTAADQPAIVADVLGQNCPAASQELTESTSYVDRTPPSSPCTYEKAVRMAPPPW